MSAISLPRIPVWLEVHNKLIVKETLERERGGEKRQSEREGENYRANMKYEIRGSINKTRRV